MRLLKFALNEVQLSAIKISLAKLESGHRARVAWFGNYSLEKNELSIHALDLITVFDHCSLETENEMELFRLRRAAVSQIHNRLLNTRNELKRRNMISWLSSYNQLEIGSSSSVDLTGIKSALKIPLEDCI